MDNQRRSRSGTQVRTVPPMRPRKADPAMGASSSAKKKKNRSGDFIKSSDIVRVRGGIDRPMLVIIVLLLCFGSVMVFSASYAFSYQKYGDSYHYIKQHLLYAGVGLLAMAAAIRFDYRWMRKITIPVFLAVSGLLVLTPMVGLVKNATRRWIVIGGIRFQPSELMKLALVLMLAWYFSRYQKYVTDYSNFTRSSIYGIAIPFGIVVFVCILIALESHFSCMIIMFLIGAVVIFAGGARKIWFLIAGGGAAVAAAFAISLSGYARSRVDVWLHPEKYMTGTIDDKIYQTVQGLYAVGSGGFLGVGLGNSRQKHLFVPEPQNDFIFSIICEELGFVGAMAVLILFLLFTWRGFYIALKAPDTFSSLVVVGIVSKTTIQAILNIAVVTSVIPNTGISLPFFSYGGTALTMLLGEMGIVLSISRYSYESARK